MNKKIIARGSATRTANMNKRRDAILWCAGDIIANEGVDKLTLYKLAIAADVTVPTIHNLLGKKEDIFEKLVEEMVQSVDIALEGLTRAEPIIAAQAFIDKLMELFSAREGLYKAAFVAGEKTKWFEQELPNGIYAKSLNICKKVCENGKLDGYLLGDINSNVLATHLFGCQRLARQDWVNGYIDLDTYRKHVLSGMLIVFLADANENYKQMLQRELQHLTAM
jgi:AcrR family transcriptional regulator